MGEPAEKETGVRGETGEPRCRAGVMDVALVGEGDPNVDIREKK